MRMFLSRAISQALSDDQSRLIFLGANHLFEFSKLLRHGQVATRQFLNGHVLRFDIGQPQVHVGKDQSTVIFSSLTILAIAGISAFSQLLN